MPRTAEESAAILQVLEYANIYFVKNGKNNFFHLVILQNTLLYFGSWQFCVKSFLW